MDKKKLGLISGIIILFFLLATIVLLVFAKERTVFLVLGLSSMILLFLSLIILNFYVQKIYMLWLIILLPIIACSIFIGSVMSVNKWAGKLERSEKIWQQRLEEEKIKAFNRGFEEGQKYMLDQAKAQLGD